MILYKRSSSRTWTPSVSFLQQCLTLEWHIFKRLIWQILALALPGVIISTVLTAAVFKYDFESLKNSKAFFTRCLTFLQNIACSEFLFSAFTTTARSPQVVAVSRCTSLGLERSSYDWCYLVCDWPRGCSGPAQRIWCVWTARDFDGGCVIVERRYHLRDLSGESLILIGEVMRAVLPYLTEYPSTKPLLSSCPWFNSPSESQFKAAAHFFPSLLLFK